jgi:hypothetical protein
MEVKIYNKTFQVQGKWIGYYVEEINEKPEYIVESITLDGREVLKLIENTKLYFDILERVVSV